MHGDCELTDRSCAFAGVAPIELLERVPRAAAPRNLAARELLQFAGSRPLVLAELPSDTASVSDHRRTLEALGGAIDGVLLGDAPWSRVQLPPAIRAWDAMQAGLRPLIGLNCRDRNRVALESELVGLAAIGVAGVLCLTGDHPELGDRPDAAPVFDLDSTGLARLASDRGMLVLGSESPAPWRTGSVGRLATKVTAGVELCIINHGEFDDIVRFATTVREAMPQVMLVASVPVAVSVSGAERVARYFPSGTDPAPIDNDFAGGVARASAVARGLLATGLIDGVDLSGAAGHDEQVLVASALRAVSERILG
jgi:5,10-methylenetetrahydrofolate reductase